MREEWVRVGNFGSAGAGSFSLRVYRSACRNARLSGSLVMHGGSDLNAALRLLRPKTGRMRRGSGAPVNRLWILRWSYMRGDKLELLNDQSAVEWDDLRAVLKPIERGFFGVVFLSTGTVVVRGFQRGRILRPFAANPEWVERDFSV